MIRDVTQLADGDVVRGVVGVVGSGFAGVDLARQLGRNGVQVVLLESGWLRFDQSTQDLAQIDSVGKPIRMPDPDSQFTRYLPPHLRGETRLRQLGGTSNIWTGKWRRFGPLDFDVRPWVDYSGWPVTLEDLRPFYDDVQRDYELGDFEAFERSELLRRLRGVAAQGGLDVSYHYWEKKPLRLVPRFIRELRNDQLVDVILGATATEVVLADDLEHVRAIAFRSLDGRRFELAAAAFVLATGGLEAPRLLLASNRQVAAGVGNQRDLVGRFYMDHPKLPKHKRAILRPFPALERPKEVATATRRKPCYHVSFALSAEVQRERSLLNHAAYLHPVYPRLFRARSRTLSQIEARLNRDARRPVSLYRVSLSVEQTPNPESRLLLASARDALGVPKLVADWQVTDRDEQSFQRTLTGLRDAFATARLGTLEYGGLTLGDTVDSSHPSGATRMAETAENGVVDRDCKVFGTANLFIASSSVFPTGHSAGPTLTIVALARRLGAHLVELHSAGGLPLALAAR